VTGVQLPRAVAMPGKVLERAVAACPSRLRQHHCGTCVFVQKPSVILCCAHRRPGIYAPLTLQTVFPLNSLYRQHHAPLVAVPGIAAPRAAIFALPE
jgi:hypothetical protein